MTETVKEIWKMCCPKCGDCQRIDICANVWVRLSPDGTDPFAADNGDHEWDEHNDAVCGTCGHHGDVAAFSKAGRAS